MTGWTEQKHPDPPIPIIYFLLSYRHWPCGRANCAHATKEENIMPQRESHRRCLTMEKYGTSQREESEKFTPDTAGSTAHVDYEGNITELGYLTFNTVGLSTTN